MRPGLCITVSNRVNRRHIDDNPAPKRAAVGRPACRRAVTRGWPSILAVVGLCLAGCSPLQLAHRTLHDELNQFPRLTDGKASCRQYKRWAHEEWDRIASSSPEAFSADYQSGFLQGFVDHVYAGGRLAPPVMPPRRYWRLPYRNEAGQVAVREWYAGFQHGARAAHEGGYRDRAIIPSSLLGDTVEGEWIELEPSPTPAEPTDETLPPEPIRLGEPSAGAASAAEPADEGLTGESASGLTPGGLPLPTIAPPGSLPAPGAARPRARNAGTGTAAAAEVDRNAETGTVGLAAAPAAATRADGGPLPLDSAADAPPPPPWATPPASGSGPHRNVRLASAQSAATGNENSSESAQGSEPAMVAEFDPFAGTQFAALSQVTSGVGGLNRPKSSDSANPTSSAGRAAVNGSWVAADDASSAATKPAPKVEPLEVMTTIPGSASTTTTLLEAPTSPAPKPPLLSPTDRQIPAASAERRGPAESVVASSPSSEEPTAADQPADNPAATGATGAAISGAEPDKVPDPGWQAVETESEARWKRKE